jgi:leucyl/phenylalanyl-tRNA--protein transferase
MANTHPVMPVFELSDDLVFPQVHHAEPDGMLAVGGDLSVERLLLAYRNGIFPWYSEGYPILWWSPDPRLILFPNEFHISRRMKRVIEKGPFVTTYDTDFRGVIRSCAAVPRHGQSGTWITNEMLEAYCALHAAGYAHSIETRLDGTLVGGLYGIALGGCFFGESMFSREPNASKVALARLVELAQKLPFELIDCQQTTHHLVSQGAREVARPVFLKLLKTAIERPLTPKKWTTLNAVAPAEPD